MGTQALSRALRLGRGLSKEAPSSRAPPPPEVNRAVKLMTSTLGAFPCRHRSSLQSNRNCVCNRKQ